MKKKIATAATSSSFPYEFSEIVKAKLQGRKPKKYTDRPKEAPLLTLLDKFESVIRDHAHGTMSVREVVRARAAIVAYFDSNSFGHYP